MDEPIRYRMYGALPYLWFAVVGIITVVGTPAAIASALLEDEPSGIAFAVVWLAVAAWLWYGALAFVSFEVLLWPDSGRVLFRSVVVKRETTLRGIAEVRASSFGQSMVSVRYKGGSARLVLPMNDFSDLIWRIREENPRVVLKGV